MSHSQFLRTCINIHFVSGFCVHHLEQSYVRQHLGTRVVNLDGYYIMLLVGNLQLMLKILMIVEVADYESRAVAFHHAGEIFQGAADVGTLALRLEVEHFSDDIENMFSSFLRRNVLLDTVREEDDTYLVIVLNGTEGECGSNLSSQIALHLLHRTEIERPADVYEQHHGKFPFLFKHLDVRLMKAGGHVPVDVSHIIAVLIFAHLGKGHSPTLEGRMILTCEDVLTQSASLDFYLPNLF